jgi:hypothetical protein
LAGYSVTYTVVDNATKQIDAINRRITQMRAPIDRMGRSLQQFVDVSGLRKVGDSFRWIASAAATAFRSISSVLGPMGVLTGAATLAGMVKLVSSFADWNRKLEENADRAGISARELQVFRDAITLAGGSADDMTETLKTLADTSAGAFRGSNTDALQWFQRAGIALTDANGKLKTSTQLLPEVLRYLDSLKNPSDRAAAAAALLGDAQAKVYESFKQSGKSLDDWVTQARQYKQLTEEQRATLDRFTLAQGKLQVAMEHLGQQASVTLAKGFTPFVDALAEFVDKNTPQIIGALQFMIDHLGTIETVAGSIAALFATKWAVGIVASIAQVVASLATLSATLSPIIAALAVIGVGAADAMIKQRQEEEAKKLGFEKRGGSLWNPFDKIPHWVNPDTGETLTEPEMRKRLGADPTTGFSPGHMPSATPPASPVAPQSAREPPPAVPGGAGAYLAGRAGQSPTAPDGPGGAPAFAGPGAPPEITQLPGDMSWGDYGTRANNPGNMNYAPGQGASARFKYTDPQTGGAHTMGVFASMQEGVAAAYRLLRRNQERFGKTLAGALHGWAENSYIGPLAKEAGLDPNQPFDIASADPETVSRIMKGQFTREGRKGSHTATLDQIREGVALGRGAAVAQGPATAPPAAPVATADPPRGSVDINITHRNPPPNSAVNVTGAGDVNVGRPRVERVDLASI